jgi:hypothetical protein
VQPISGIPWIIIVHILPCTEALEQLIEGDGLHPPSRLDDLPDGSETRFSWTASEHLMTVP